MVGDHNADMLKERLPDDGSEISFSAWQADCIQWNEMTPGVFMTLSNSLLELGKVERGKKGTVWLVS